MKTIYFIRHAKSSWADMSLSDHDRPLNKRGKRDAPFMAELLHTAGVKVDGFISSTAKRARRTAEAFAAQYDRPKRDIRLTKDLYHAHVREITRVVKGLPDDLDTVLIFGHNPGWTDLVNDLDGDYIDNVPTCGIVGCQSKVEHWKDWRPETAKRHRFYYPKQYFK